MPGMADRDSSESAGGHSPRLNPCLAGPAGWGWASLGMAALDEHEGVAAQALAILIAININYLCVFLADRVSVLIH